MRNIWLKWLFKKNRCCYKWNWISYKSKIKSILIYKVLTIELYLEHLRIERRLYLCHKFNISHFPCIHHLIIITQYILRKNQKTVNKKLEIHTMKIFHNHNNFHRNHNYQLHNKNLQKFANSVQNISAVVYVFFQFLFFSSSCTKPLSKQCVIKNLVVFYKFNKLSAQNQQT